MILQKANNLNISSLKEKIRSYKTSNNSFKKSLYLTILFLWRLVSIPYRFILNPEYRSLIWLKYTKGHEVHQVSNHTEYNRYPDLFSKCKELMIGKKDLKILSYGCSTGEEVFTLREYFPDALIVGVDINKRNIKQAISQNNDDKVIFSSDIENTLTKNGPVDIIFALTVFQRTENRNEETFDSSTIYPFKKFDTKVMELDRHLKLNGIFVIDYSDYHFEDTHISGKYEVVKGKHNNNSLRNLYDKSNQKILDFPQYNRIYSKIN